MFWPEKMCKVRLYGLKTNTRKTVGLLESYGGAELKEFDSGEAENLEPLKELEETVERLVHIEALLKVLEEQPVKKKMDSSEAERLLKSGELKRLGEKISGVNSALNEKTGKIELLRERKEKLRLYARFGIDFGKTDFESIELVAGAVARENKGKLENEISKLGNEAFTEKPLSKSKNFYMIAVERGRAEEFSESAARLGFERQLIPEMSSAPAAELKKAEAEILKLEREKASLEKNLAGIARKKFSVLAALKEFLEIRRVKASIVSSFGATEHAFVLEAFLPEKNFAEFSGLLEKTFGKKVFVRKFSSEEIEKNHEHAPTLLKHSPVLAPFEFMTKFVSVPKYNEIDPAIIFLIFFPFIYGMIVGDFFYGLVSFLLARFILSKSPKESILNPVAKIWMWCAIPTLIFGIIFDEYAGMPNKEIFTLLGFEHFELYTGLERMHNIEAILAMTVLVGFALVALGFLLGFINASRHNDRKHMMAKLGWFGVTAFGAVFVSTLMFKAFPQELLLPSGILLGISLIPVLMVEGMVGVIEVPSVLGNVLSFARILAVGLVGVVVALILNDLAFPSLDKGLLVIILLPLYIFGHIFNVFLAMFEALIQGARLNYVEFYSKFYEGGGREFEPFRLERKYTKEG